MKKQNKKGLEKIIKVGKYLLTGALSGLVGLGIGYNISKKPQNCPNKVNIVWEYEKPEIKIIDSDKEYLAINGLNINDNQVYIENSDRSKKKLSKLVLAIDRSYGGGVFNENNASVKLFKKPLYEVLEMSEDNTKFFDPELNFSAYVNYEPRAYRGLINSNTKLLTEIVDNMLIYADRELGNSDYKIQTSEIDALINKLKKISSDQKRDYFYFVTNYKNNTSKFENKE